MVDRKIDYMHNQAFGVETNSGGIAIKDSGGTQRVTKDLNPFFHSDWDWEGRRPSPERTFFVVCHSCYTLCESIPGNTEPHSPICGQWPIDRAQRQGLIHQTPSRASGGCDSGKGVLSLSRPRPKFGRQWILWLDRMQANGTHRLVGEAAGHREDRQADIQQSCVRTRQWSLQPRMDHMFRQ